MQGQLDWDGQQQGTNYHNFADSLEKSHEAESMPFWGEVYQKAFPNMVAMPNHRQDGDHQRQGIDRSVIMNNGKQVGLMKRLGSVIKIPAKFTMTLLSNI